MNMLKPILKRILTAGVPVNRLTRPVFAVLYKMHVVLREGGIWGLRFFFYEPMFKSQCARVGKGLWMEQLPYMVNPGIINIGCHVRLSGKPSFMFSSSLHPNPAVTIGDNTFIGHQTSFSVGKAITIGHDCLIAGGVLIADNDGHPLDHEARRHHMPPRMEDVREVRIGNNVWIGSGAVILKGVTIGDRAVVGARAVITSDVPSDVVMAGNPARIIKRLGSSHLTAPPNEDQTP